MDPRVNKLAELLINYSLNLKKGQLLKIRGEVATLPLVEAAYEKAVRKGANAYTEIIVPDNLETLLKHGSDDQLVYLSPMSRLEANKLDALLVIWGSENTRHLSGIEPSRQAIMQKGRRRYLGRIYERIGKRTLSWVGTQFPTLGNAQDADMSLSDYEDFVYGAGHLHAADPVKHWKKVGKEQRRLKKILDRVDRLQIRTSDTDLSLRVKGRKWVSCHGTENFPDGEVFTSPIENSAEGTIRFTYPVINLGREVDGVELQIRKGKVVNERASKNQQFLTEMLNSDRGARYLGEVAIGTNYDIKRFTRNILFDEKIGGTCHIAVGASILEAGGKNKSGLHMDMVCDLKKGGEVIADGKIIYRNGKFTI